VLGELITVRGSVDSIDGEIALVHSEAEQAGNRIIRNAEAEVR
jgi:hypothetical protein